VAGSSAGGLCAYLAGVHARPKPKAVLSLYGMGGDFFVSYPLNYIFALFPDTVSSSKTPHYLTPKTKPFFKGRELLDILDFQDYLYPNSNTLPSISQSSLTYYGTEYHIPGYPSNPRMLLARLYLQLGSYLDYYTGKHDPSVSKPLQDTLGKDHSTKVALAKARLSPKEQSLFPQLYASEFPPSFFIHGSEDTAVPVTESHYISNVIQVCGVQAVLKVCEGMEHSFDYEADADKKWSDTFDNAFEFLDRYLRSA